MFLDNAEFFVDEKELSDVVETPSNKSTKI